MRTSGAQVVRAGARLRMALEAERRPVGAARCPAASRRTATGASRARSAGSVDSSTAKPWFWLEMNTRPLVELDAPGDSRRDDRTSSSADRRAAGETEQLVAEADAEHRDADVQRIGSDRLDRVGARLRIAGTVRTGTRRRAASTSRRRPMSAPGRPSCGSRDPASSRRMLRLSPKSYATTCSRWPGAAFGPCSSDQFVPSFHW